MSRELFTVDTVVSIETGELLINTVTGGAQHVERGAWIAARGAQRVESSTWIAARRARRLDGNAWSASHEA